MHPLRMMLDDAARGTFPPVDGGVEVFEPADDGHAAIVEFTGHAVVLTDLDVTTLTAMGADGFGGASRPEIKLMLGGPGGWIGCHDAVLVASGRGDGMSGPLDVRTDLDDHPRVVRSREHRRDVVVLADHTGVATIGAGLVGRTELSVELLAGVEHSTNAGRVLIEASLRHVPSDDVVWAQVSPGNAASLRAFLAAGFRPIGAETLIIPAR